ncbi:winged helix-turn-helix domain-containing protein [Magnetovibrio sp.]|uniref:winged helix-turn-helix domain-containing protein n=1 Tax=Magnetovibrio sp. TaxID=2024836 RepID=UPI002F93BC70
MTGHEAKVRLKIQLNGTSIGPGKIMLLESVVREGSISSAARAMGMAYRRAWHLLNTLQEAFDQPVITTEMGGKEKGGATLTPLGKDLIDLYRAAEAKACKDSEPLLKMLAKHAP